MTDMATAQTLIDGLGKAARKAAVELAQAPAPAKRAALMGAADAVIARTDDILAANEQDLQFGRDKGLSDAMMDRLRLDPQRLQAIA
ncbi:Gamma-glutamyl phosphate reductase (GPR), partial [marine sediment metagenome]